MQWWAQWKFSARDQQTFCVSCHTAVPYALARPRLRDLLGERGPGDLERKLLDNVRRRVQLWATLNPFYRDSPEFPGKSAQSRGTEAVLNALILTSNDAASGQLSADARTALDNMWALQQLGGNNRGSWDWLDFELAPWEVADARYYGAILGAMAVGMAPQSYRTDAAVAPRVQALREYLADSYSAQPLHFRLLLLWASTKFPELLSGERRQSIIDETAHLQNPDGGWSLSQLSQPQMPVVMSDAHSDGYATGLATLALRASAAARADAVIKRGLSWLGANQSGRVGIWTHEQQEFWVTTSLNKRRDLSGPVGKFMSDAATSYAVLALTESPDAMPPRAAAR
jgi:squalene-hopene/tetraprenyl-beta-curcumene cyclase